MAHQETVHAGAPANGQQVGRRLSEAELRERRVLSGVTFLCAVIGATVIYWLLWRRDFGGWRTVAERRYRVVPAPPLTGDDLLPVDPAFVMRPAVDFANVDTSRFFRYADHLTDAEIVLRSPDVLRFIYQGHPFELGQNHVSNSMCLFVEDPDCPDELLLEVANHFNSVATVVEHYHQPAPLRPLWNVLTVLAILGVISAVVLLVAD